MLARAQDSDIIHTRVLGQDVICLNSYQAANDLIDKRSSNYDDRPRFRLFDVMGWAPTLTFLSSASPRFKLHRSLFQTSFSNTAIRSFQPVQIDEAKKAVKGIIERPDEWEEVTLEMATGIIWRVAFGRGFTSLAAAQPFTSSISSHSSGCCDPQHSAKSASIETKGRNKNNNRFLELAKQAAEVTTTGGFPGLNLVDLIPGIQWLPDIIANPLVPVLAHARRSRQVIESMTTEPWIVATCSLKEGRDGDDNIEIRRSFIGRFYDRIKDNSNKKESIKYCQSDCILSSNIQGEKDNWPSESVGMEAGLRHDGALTRDTTAPLLSSLPQAHILEKLTENDLRGAATAILVAGGSTTWSTVLACLLFLTIFPDAQTKIQRELDKCIDSSPVSKLPNFEDLPRLPYLCGFVHEALRLLPLNPIIIPHSNTTEDLYRGYRIPAKSTILVNAKAINMDPTTYLNPEKFEPERFMSTKDGGREEPPPLGNFGFGRRKCPGRELALQGVRICLAVMLSVLQVEEKDENPKHVGVSLGLGGHPQPFTAKMSVRRADMAEILLNDIESNTKS